jgi:hypothetical protein
MVTKSEAFPSRFWKSTDLPPRGLVLKIAKLALDKVGMDQKEKYTLYFKGQDKQLVLNGTNWDSIAAFCGGDSDQWTGKDVILFPTTTTFGGKTVDCIRIRQSRPPAAAPVAKAPDPAPPTDDEGDPGWQPDPDAVEVDDYRV